MIDWETFQDAYAKAPKSVQDFIDSEEINSFVDGLIRSHSLPDSIKKTLILVIIDRAVSGLSESDFVTQLELLAIPEPAIVEIVTLIDRLTGTGSLPQIRTMPPAPTAPEETVYTSTQAAILHESVATPPATEPNTVRWDTERS